MLPLLVIATALLRAPPPTLRLSGDRRIGRTLPALDDEFASPPAPRARAAPRTAPRRASGLSYVRTSDAGSLLIKIPRRLGADALMGGAFSAAWFSAIVPATLSGGAPLLFMVPFWLAGGLVVKQTVIDPALATEVSIGRYAWSCKAVGPGGVVVKEREGATDDLRGATAEIAAYVNGVPQCALRLLVDGAEPVSLGASLAPDELDAIADQINAFLDDVDAPAASGAPTMRLASRPRAPQVQMNWFGDVFDQKLKPQKPYERPLLPSLVKKDVASYVLQEKMLSFSGEDFRVRDAAGNEVMRIEGANVNLPGVGVIDKLGFKDAKGRKFCSVERRILATTTCYDIYDADGKECVAKIDREMFSATPEYKFYYEGDLNPFPDMKATGSFLDRKYTFTSGSGDVIARVGRDFEFIKDVDTYQVDVAAGVDAAAILAMAVVIDEDHDEKDAKEEREKEEKGGWPFG